MSLWRRRIIVFLLGSLSIAVTVALPPITPIPHHALHPTTPPPTEKSPAISPSSDLDAPIHKKKEGAPPGHSTQRERITQFQSRVTVHKEGHLSVTETITLKTYGRSTQMPMYRELPTNYITQQGERKQVYFNILKARLNGVPIPYHIEKRRNYERVYLGYVHQNFKPGTHTFVLTYTIQQQLTHKAGEDQLTWNITGSGWRLPIDAVSARIQLPPRATSALNNLEAYALKAGKRINEPGQLRQEAGVIHFEWNHRLSASESVWLHLAWAPGLVSAPTPWPGLHSLFHTYFESGSAVLGFLLLMLFYVLIWRWHHDPPLPHTLSPQSSPPDNYSPAVLCFLNEMGCSPKLFIATLIQMAIKGYIRIKKGIHHYSLVRISASTQSLSLSEEIIAKALFSKQRQEIPVHPKYQQQFRQAVASFRRSLRREIEAVYLMKNTAYLLIGILLSLAALLPALTEAPTLLLLLTPYLMCCAMGFIAYYVRNWMSTFGLLLLFLGVGAAWAWHSSWVAFWVMEYPVFFGCVLLMTGAHLWFYKSLKRPTLKGRELLERTLSFRKYLSSYQQSTASVDQVSKGAAVFEQYFPYALVFDIEEIWSKQFQACLQARGEYCPDWYLGGSFQNLDRQGYGVSFFWAFSKEIDKMVGRLGVD